MSRDAPSVPSSCRSSIYLDICGCCFRRAWTTLALFIPGPTKPSLLALNRILDPLITDCKRLEVGIMANVFGRPDLQSVKLQILFVSSDMPAIRKLAVSMSHGSWTLQPLRGNQGRPTAAGSLRSTRICELLVTKIKVQ